MFQEVSSVTLGVETPELCQQICQVSILGRSYYHLSVFVYYLSHKRWQYQKKMNIFLAAFFILWPIIFFLALQADPACVAITWTQDSFPVYPLRWGFGMSNIWCLRCFDIEAFEYQIIFYAWELLWKMIVKHDLLRSCARFSSTDNATQCEDCVSGWEDFGIFDKLYFFCWNEITSCGKKHTAHF